MPRARVKLDLSGVAELPWLQESGVLKVREFTVDCFDPPDRLRLLPEILRLRGEGLTQRIVADQVGSHQATVQRAEKLHRLMREAETCDPYAALTEPHVTKRHRRHLHEEYRLPDRHCNEASPGDDLAAAA